MKKRRVSTKKVFRLIRNLVFVLIIGLIVLGSFRVRALASVSEEIPEMAPVVYEVKGPAVERVYYSIQVQKGDTLWELAKMFCDGRDLNSYVDELMELNQINDAHRLPAGSYLIVSQVVPAA